VQYNRNYFGTIYDFIPDPFRGPELCFERLLSAAPDGIYDSGPVLNREGVQDGFRRSGAIETAV
jgi:hypothetical protein